MIQLHENSIYLVDGRPEEKASIPQNEARKQTMAWQILQAHNTSGDPERLKIRFDAMVSHDITYVGIIQQARASGMKEFPIPYALTNCHNSLCAVGGTINEDDHVFGLSAAKKYGGIYVPANQSVIHSYAREELARCGAMILGSDSHTRYGALGTMAVGEGGPELAKQLLKNTWDVNMPKVVLVYMTGAPRRGVGPHDVAISLVKETFASGFVNNCVLEFCGPGIANLPIDFRNGIDVMTTETTCLSSIWETDEITRGFFETHGRPQDYAELHPGREAWYDKMIPIELDKVEPMIALPFHPSNAYPIREFLANAKELLEKVEQDAARRFPKAHVKLTDKLQQTEITERQFVSDASHELKTPLASIKLLSDSILQNEMDTDTMREFVADIGAESDRLTRMAQKLLTLSRASADETEGGEHEVVDVGQTLSRVFRMLVPLADRQAVKLTASVEKGCTILSFEDDAYQILFNLVENGIKYNRENGSVHVRVRHEEDTVVIDVEDTGSGIPENALDSIFNRFYRVDKARSRQAGGAGLGLSIVHEMVGRNFGTISVRSTVGEGSCFTVTFPSFGSGEEDDPDA